MESTGSVVICPKCGWFGHSQKPQPSLCPMCPKREEQQMIEVRKMDWRQFSSLSDEDESILKQSAIEKYCQNLDPIAVEKREKFDANLKKLEREGERKFVHQPKCPTCGSTNISKIGGLERGASVAMWGLFSKKINKSFKCNNPDCGYTW